jgi:hypothetical protein
VKNCEDDVYSPNVQNRLALQNFSHANRNIFYNILIDNGIKIFQFCSIAIMQKNMTAVALYSLLIDLFSGFSFRNKVEDEPGGDIAVIQMRDLKDDYTSIGAGLAQVSLPKINNKYFLQGGDVLFVAKGANNHALVYNLNLPKAIASSAFFILRSDQSKVMPAYLAWYINQLPVQQYLKEKMAGTYVPNVTKSIVEGITIALLPLEVQKKIAAIDYLQKQEQRLMTEIMTKREVALRTVLLGIAKGINTVGND